MKNLLSTAIAALIISTSGPVFGGDRPVPVRGEIASFSPQMLEVTGRDNETRKVYLAENFQIVGIEARTLDDIKVGDFVSSTAVPDGNGGFKALQISILPPALAGANEGQHPWDAAPESVMTNAAISGVAAESGETQDTLTLSYDGDKEFEIHVPAETPIVGFIPGNDTLLIPGAEVFIVAINKEMGLVTNRIIAETDGVKPPM